MPCRCDDYGDSHGEAKELLDKVTRAACDMRTILRRHGLEYQLTLETCNWIAKHDAEDEARIAKEEAVGERMAARVGALAKLTMDDRRVLGL